MSGTVSFSGLATTMDTKTIVSQLMALERRPETLLNNQKSALQSKIDIFDKLNSSLKSLQELAAGMNSPATFAAKSVAIADSSILTAQTSGAAVAGTHTLVVTQLASSQRQVSAGGYASASDLNFNSGTISITDDKGGSPVSVAIGAGSNSLNGIAAAINSAGGKFSATIINDGSSGSPYRLMISGLDTKNYTVGFAGLSTPPAAANGASYSNPAFPQSGATYISGSDASFTLDGVAMTRSSNMVGDALPGVTLNLLKGGGASTSFTISNDSAAVTAKINSFISSYNSAIGIIHEQSVYNSTTKKAGVLSGDSTIRSLQSELQGILGSQIDGATNAYSIASQVGIKTKSDGTLELDAVKLSAALGANFDGVVDLFTRNSSTSALPANQYGIAEQFNQKLNLLTKPYISANYSGNGLIASRINSIKSQMTSIDAQVARMEVLMVQKEASMNRQFTAMETLVSSLQTQGSQLTSILASMNNSNNSSN
jgi:flagellar hook-associated protein 2